MVWVLTRTIQQRNLPNWIFWRIFRVLWVVPLGFLKIAFS